MLLTQNKTIIIGQVAAILGIIMNGIFWLQSQIGLANIGLCIILFTLVIYLLMTPLTIQQQKFSKLQGRMNPEIQAIQKKYKGKEQDQTAMMKMNEETKAVYAKYGVNPMGSCLQLLIQMPILFALYQVIWNVPAYVTMVKDAFSPLASQLLTTAGAEEYLTTLASSISRVSFPEFTENRIIDLLYKLNPSNWSDLAAQFPNLSDMITSTQTQIDKMNYFLGLNIADSPSSIISSALSSKAYLLAFGAILIPILAAVTQWLNSKLMMASTDNAASASTSGGSDTMAATMKSMNTVMPIMSAVFCFTLPTGLGLYWIAGAVIRSIQQVFLNRKMDQMDIDELIRKNLEKENAKRAKQGLPPQKVKTTPTVGIKEETSKETKEVSAAEYKNKISKATEYYQKNTTAKPGSLAAKAQMVKQYNDRNLKK